MATPKVTTFHTFTTKEKQINDNFIQSPPSLFDMLSRVPLIGSFRFDAIETLQHNIIIIVLFLHFPAWPNINSISPSPKKKYKNQHWWRSKKHHEI